VRTWVDENLEPLVRKSIPPDIDPPSSQLPRRLDKPSYSAASQSYAEILKKQFSLTSNPSATTTDNNRPPRKRQATKLDYDSDASEKSLPPTSAATTTENNNYLTPAKANPATSSEAQISELLSLKNEIAQLKTTIMTAVQEIAQAVASLHATHRQPQSNAMDDETETCMSDGNGSNEHNNNKQLTIDLAALVQDLKFNISTIVTKTRALFKQQVLFTQNNNSPASCYLNPIVNQCRSS